jgi:uncharacterized membrane protein
MRRGSSRGWLAFTLIGIALWIGAMVLVGVVNDDPADPTPTLVAFIAGGVLFFGTMFGVALWQQLRWRAESDEARFGRGVAIGYSITGAVVTGLGLAAIWRAGIQGEDAGVFLYPLIAIVAVWAVAALLLVRRYTGD